MLSPIKKDQCCAAERISLGRRLSSTTSWILPGAVLVFIPKCPVCIIAYVALISGVGLSVSTATNLRTTLIAISSAWLLYFSVSSLLSVRRNYRREI